VATWFGNHSRRSHFIRCKQALPGEFTRRAVLNGKLDILQAEASVIDSASSHTMHARLGAIDGGLSRRLSGLRSDLIELRGPDCLTMSTFRKRMMYHSAEPGLNSRRKIATCSMDYSPQHRAGEVIREGRSVVIAGPPNAGEILLFNALLGR